MFRGITNIFPGCESNSALKRSTALAPVLQTSLLFLNFSGSTRHLFMSLLSQILGSIVVSIPACHAGDRGSIPRRGGLTISFCLSFDMGWL